MRGDVQRVYAGYDRVPFLTGEAAGYSYKCLKVSISVILKMLTNADEC